MASRAPRNKKRTKTYTGCWTCRDRKVKCDEAEPECLQCSRKGLSCGGYSIRLQWLPPAVPHASGQDVHLIEPDSAPTSALRRVLPAEPCRNVLLPSQLDEIFKEIDDYDPSQSLEHNLPVQLNNFAVFRCTPSRPSVGPVVCAPPPSTPSFHSLDSPLTTGSLCRAASASDTEPQGGRVTLSPQALAASIQNEATVAVAVSGALPVDDLSDQYYSTAILPGSQHDVFVTHRPSENGDHDFPQASNNSSPYDWLNQIPANDQPLHPAPQVDDFLMRHYMERVCYLFCAIDTPKSPWKTIHLPRALQGIGELKITGHTSKVRNALRNALLSISSWYLSNDCRRHDADDVADRWADVATDYGSDAIALLKSAIEFDLYHSTRPRYKDFLATMLSMITVNVMSGNTSTCGVHLDGAHQLFLHIWDKKRAFSEKTKTLQRIYYYLRIIWESTQVRDLDLSNPPSRLFASDLHPEAFKQQEGSNRTMNPSSPSNELFLASSFESIYGIPQTLLAMLEETIRVVDKVDQATKALPSRRLPEDLDMTCDELEQKIFDWSMEQDLHPYLQTSSEPNANIIRHQTKSFHNALIIFFSQTVRSLNYRYLQQYVESILQSIEAIEQIKAETCMLAAPLFWPAFIAATATFNMEYQDRFRTWYQQTESYGIATVRTGIQVILEVWRMGPPKAGSADMCPWRRVVKLNGENLMLS